VEQTLPRNEFPITTYKHPVNHFEYPGILRLWEEGQADFPGVQPEDHYLLYFHAKGMFNGRSDGVIRTENNLMLSNLVIKPWRNITARFQNDPNVNKAGYAPSEAGFVWYNFFWVRASKLRKIRRPILQNDRMYYEGWVSIEYPDALGPDDDPAVYRYKLGGPNDTLALCPGNCDAVLGFSWHPIHGHERCYKCLK
jgi:hypothetical protein